MSETEQICDVMIAYIRSLEVPHPLFSGLPICPFVKAARLQNKLEFWVYPFPVGHEIDVGISQKIEEFLTVDHQKDVLLVIHPDPSAIDFVTFTQFIKMLNQQLGTSGLIAFGGHPDDPFEVNGVRTRHNPFINFTVQQIQELLDARQSLIHINYYSTWNTEALDAVGVKIDVFSADSESV